MTKDEYTPNTGEVRDAYDLHRLRSNGSKDGDEEFDRWLAEIRAAAWDQGAQYMSTDRWPDIEKRANNPYRRRNP